MRTVACLFLVIFFTAAILSDVAIADVCTRDDYLNCVLQCYPKVGVCLWVTNSIPNCKCLGKERE